MSYARKRTIAASSMLALLIGCGGGAKDSTNTAGGSTGSGGASATGGASAIGGGAGTTMMASSGGASGAPFAGTAGTGVAAGAGGALSMGGVPSGGAGNGSGAGGTSAGTGSVVEGGLTLTIEPNPNSVVSCLVSWKTDAPASSVVQFGLTDYQYEISDATPVAEHKVVVIGMRAEQTYQIKAISGSASGEGTFTTGKLPAQIPNGTVMVNEATSRAPGWTLLNVEQGGADNRPRSAVPPAAVIYDEAGFVVWYYIDGPGKDIGGAVSTQFTDKGVVIGPTWNEQTTNGVPPREIDWGGNIIWECKHAACLPGKNVTHETQKLSNGHYVILEYVGTGTQNPVFREVDADSKEVWSLDWNALLPAPANSMGDWCHANAINIDIEKNEVYANCRWVGMMKTTYMNPTKQWLIPAKYGSKGQGDFTYMPSTSQYSDAHSPDFYDDTNTALFYDNGGYSGSVDTLAGTYHSRAVEYTIDVEKKTATLTWEFPGTFQTPDDWYQTKWYSPFWGDVDRLANGNILIAGGMIGVDKPESRVFEVTKAEGKVIWELRLPKNFGVYRSERGMPGIVHALAQ
jgi:hypothetical protein